MSTDVETPPVEEQPVEKMDLEVKIDKPSACVRHVTVTISRKDIDRYLDKAFSDLRPKAQVPGFRPGKAPRKIVEKTFRKDVEDQVKGSLLMDSLTQISTDYDFSAISEPDFKFDAIEIPSDGPLTFEFSIEVRPEFDLPTWKGLSIDKPTHIYTPEDVDKQLNKLLARFGTLRTVDDAAAEGDHIAFDVNFYDGEELISSAKDVSVEIKPNLSLQDALLSGFDKLVIGAKAGDERTATMTVAPGAERQDLVGKEVTAKFTILEVKRLEMPELTPAFLDRIGGFKDEGDLRDTVKAELERQLEYRQQQAVRRQITSMLTAAANWELPADLLKRQSRRELERAVLELQRSGFSADEIRARMNDIRRDVATNTATFLKEHFILEKIAEEEKIEAEAQDYDEEIALIAAQTNESPRRVRARLEKRGLMDTLRNQIVERKVIKLIQSHANFIEQPLPPEADDTAAIEVAVCGEPKDAIPEAQPGEEPKDKTRTGR